MSGERWEPLLQEASRLRRAGRLDEAIATYRRLLALKPDLPDSWYNLGWLQRQSGQFKDALEAYERALVLGVTAPEEVHLNRAVIYSDHLYRPADAERELHAALTKHPSYVPALLNLGNLFEDAGERAQARAAYEKVLAIDSQHSLALARLAGVSHSPTLDASLATQLRMAIAAPTKTSLERADLAFALAGLLDAAGQYDEAFEAASTANAASRAAAGVSYDRAGHEQFVDRLIATFSRPSLPANSAENPPIFICGMFRSGSTLVEQLLASHSEVAAGGELSLIPAIVEQIAPYPQSVADADAAGVLRWKDLYLGGLRARSIADPIVTDKRPDNFLHIGLIKTLFPSAKIVHTRRNPLDNILSIHFLHLDPRMAYAFDLEDTAHFHREYRRLMEHWKSLYPNDILDVDYDLLVGDPRSVVWPLLKFLGLEWQDEVLEFQRRRSAVKTASVWQVREPLHVRSRGRWRNYEDHLHHLDDMLFPD